MRIGEAYVFIKILWPADKTVWSPPGLPLLRGRGLARGVGRVFASRRGDAGVFRAANRYTVSLQGVRGGVAPPHGGGRGVSPLHSVSPTEVGLFGPAAGGRPAPSSHPVDGGRLLERGARSPAPARS